MLLFASTTGVTPVKNTGNNRALHDNVNSRAVAKQTKESSAVYKAR
jgi:hypothetical protein